MGLVRPDPRPDSGASSHVKHGWDGSTKWQIPAYRLIRPRVLDQVVTELETCRGKLPTAPLGMITKDVAKDVVPNAVEAFDCSFVSPSACIH